KTTIYSATLVWRLILSNAANSHFKYGSWQVTITAISGVICPSVGGSALSPRRCGSHYRIVPTVLLSIPERCFKALVADNQEYRLGAPSLAVDEVRYGQG